MSGVINPASSGSQNTPTTVNPTVPPTPVVVNVQPPAPADPSKKWYESKTIWFNGIAFASIVIQAQNGFIISPVEQGAIIIVVNLALRMITSKGLE